MLPKLQEIIKLFQSVQEPKANFNQGSCCFACSRLSSQRLREADEDESDDVRHNVKEKRGAEMLRRGFDLE
uniref:Uncharacterized protein n=1 Tax=Salix viminalis TaxID=40686 RepID=A0A6N2NCX5_SALVM